MLSGNGDDEASQRAALLRGIRRANIAGIEIASELIIIIDAKYKSIDGSQYIGRLFTHLINFPESPLSIAFHHPVTHLFTINASDMQDNAKRMGIVTHPDIVSDSILKGLLLALQACSLRFDYDAYSSYLRDQVERVVSLKSKNLAGAAVFRCFCCIENITALFKFDNNTQRLEANIRIILPLIDVDNFFDILTINIELALLKQIMQRLDKEQRLVHLFFKKKEFSCDSSDTSLKKLLSLLDNQTDSLTDEEGNNFLHVCRVVDFLPIVFPLVTDVNGVNKAGNTALHQAALDSDMEKYQYLVAHGANPALCNNDGMKPILLVPKSDKPLSMFADCHRHGKALLHPPFVPKQQGQTCGIYAAFTATFYHWVSNPGLFNAKPLHARKRDVVANSPFSSNNAKKTRVDNSLREYAKTNNKTWAGEMLSLKSMSDLIEKNNCTSMLTRPESFDRFIEEIEAALSAYFPVIIPYSTDLQNKGMPQAFDAHWSMIIGYYQEPETKAHKVLLAHWGKYELINADKLYRGFALIEDTFPECYLFKTVNNEWQQSKTKDVDDPIKTIELPEKDLNEDFKGGLLTVLPPGMK